MKIDLQNTINYHTPSVESRRQSALSSTPAKVSGNYDAITIRSEQETTPEQRFADALSSRLSLEVRKPTSPSQVQNLQQQIEQGTYEVDVNSIVDRIMLY